MGYEEILLPTACLNSSGCRLGLLNGWTSAGSNHVRYRVYDRRRSEKLASHDNFFDCAAFSAARAGGVMLDLWHPVKNRTCVFDAFDLQLTRSSNHKHHERGAAITADPCICLARSRPAERVAKLAIDELRARSVRSAEAFRRWEEKEETYVAYLRVRERVGRIAAMAARDGISPARESLPGYPPHTLSATPQRGASRHLRPRSLRWYF